MNILRNVLVYLLTALSLLAFGLPPMLLVTALVLYQEPEPLRWLDYGFIVWSLGVSGMGFLWFCGVMNRLTDFDEDDLICDDEYIKSNPRMYDHDDRAWPL